VSLGQAEEELRTSGRDLMRATLQAVVDAACAAQERVPGGMDGPDGVRGTRVEDGHARTVATVFGRITVDRLAYRAAGASNVHPLDEVLDLPEGLYSTGLARLSVREAVRGSFGEAGDAVEYVTGIRIGTRQLIELTRAAAGDAADYYTARQAPPAGPGDALVITADGKGIPVRPEALRAGTAKLETGANRGRAGYASCAAVSPPAAAIPRMASLVGQVRSSVPGLQRDGRYSVGSVEVRQGRDNGQAARPFGAGTGGVDRVAGLPVQATGDQRPDGARRRVPEGDHLDRGQGADVVGQRRALGDRGGHTQGGCVHVPAGLSVRGDNQPGGQLAAGSESQ
jgi:hypothetical protein